MSNELVQYMLYSVRSVPSRKNTHNDKNGRASNEMLCGVCSCAKGQPCDPVWHSYPGVCFTQATGNHSSCYLHSKYSSLSFPQ